MRRRPTDLPIEAVVEQLDDPAIDVVLTAEPGAGKSSVVPLVVAAASPGRVVVLEPRRLAARATAERLAASLTGSGAVGDLVGLTMRGERRVGDNTRIEVVTEAILTARLQRDPELKGVSALVFDEFHERNLHSDLALAMALEVRQSLRDDLRLVVMSATLDPGPVSGLLRAATGRSARHIAVEGRTFPIETIHLGRPDTTERPGSRKGNELWARAVAAGVARALAETDGAVLAFVPGRREIGGVCTELARLGTDVPVIGLHGTSTTAERRAALDPGGRRRVVVATAVAETSLTLAGVTAVVDGGLQRRARFDGITGMGRLETTTVTLGSADQRRGRAGRLGPGRCYRLWSPADERHFDPADPPEILIGDPLPVAFELIRWGDATATTLPLIDRPDPGRLGAATNRLIDLGLVERPDRGQDPGDPRLTSAGRMAGRLGVDPRSAALLLHARGNQERRRAAEVVVRLETDGIPSTDDFERELADRSPDRRRLGQLLRRLDQVAPVDATDSVRRLGIQLAEAWPDRVAVARPDRPGVYALAAGREVLVADGPLQGSECLVVVDAAGVETGGVSGLRLRRGVPLTQDELLTAVGNAVETVDIVAWDPVDDNVRAERRQQLGALVLNRSPLSDPSPEALRRAFADGLARPPGLDRLGWGPDGRQLRARLAWLHRERPDEWPDLTEAALLDRLDEWLDLSGCRRPADLVRLPAVAGLLGLLSWEQRQALDILAPDALALPNGRLATVDYAGADPVWAVRLQRLLGLDQHPLIGPDRRPVVIELLSPADRPVQRTTDLPGFWRGSYADVRRDLRGRYPKHAWPTEPWLG